MAAPVGASEGLAALTLGGMGRAPALGATGPLGQGQPDTAPAKPLAAPCRLGPAIDDRRRCWRVGR